MPGKIGLKKLTSGNRCARSHYWNESANSRLFLCLLRYLQWPISEQNYSDALQAGSEENITQALDWKRVVRTANVFSRYGMILIENRIKWNGMEWNGMKQNTTECNGIEQNAMERIAMERNVMERNRIEWNGIKQNRTEWKIIDGNWTESIRTKMNPMEKSGQKVFVFPKISKLLQWTKTLP